MLLLKSSTVVDDYMYIYPLDPAIDRDLEGWRKELDAACLANDLDRLPLRPAQKPTVFWLSHPRGELKRHVTDLCTSAVGTGGFVAYRKIAALCLVKVENFSDSFEFKRKALDPEGKFQCVNPSVMDSLDDVNEGDLVNCLGQRVVTDMTPDPSLPKDSG